jgi:hypothetical protein
MLLFIVSRTSKLQKEALRTTSPGDSAEGRSNDV